MELEAISGAATVALTSTIVFLLVARTWTAISRSIGSAPSFADRIMHEAAQHFREELERLTASQATYLSGILVFVMLFVAAYGLQAKRLFSGYPSWQLYLQLGFLLLVACFAVYSLSKTTLRRRQTKFLRDANIAIGHQLQQLASGAMRVFHEVETSAGIIDHVIVGSKGVYAVNVVARRSRQLARATINVHENCVDFSNSDAKHSIVDINAKTVRLQKDFQKLLGHDVRVRSVIAVPGWDVNEQSTDKHLMVNERTIGMLRGWTDQSDYLMNEDVDALQAELTSQCARSRT